MTDKGQIAGRQVSNHMLQELADELRRMRPRVLPAIEIVDGVTMIAMRATGGVGLYCPPSAHSWMGEGYV